MNFVSRVSSRETLRFERNKIHCSPRDQSFVIQQNKTKAKFENRAEIPAITYNSAQISRVTVNCFPFDVIVFAMLPAHREFIKLRTGSGQIDRM